MNPTCRLVVSMDDQRLRVCHGDSSVREFPASTSAKGMGFANGSLRTPTGRFRIVEKIGHGEAAGTIFQSRKPVGRWNPGESPDEDLILTRILRLEGLDDANSNTLERCIYIHGTNREDLLGQPAGHGCVRLGNDAMIALFEMVSEGCLVEILPLSRRRGKLLFMACDSTLCSIEGIDELARQRGPGVFKRVSSLTSLAKNGGASLGESLAERLDLIRPDRAMCGQVAWTYRQAVLPEAVRFLDLAKDDGWLPVILSGGFTPMLKPLAEHLKIRHVEAVSLRFNEEGDYAGYSASDPTARSSGKREVIRDWTSAMLPERVVMIGSGAADLETRNDVDLFIGFGGVVSREIVKTGCDRWVEGLIDNSVLSPARAG